MSEKDGGAAFPSHEAQEEYSERKQDWHTVLVSKGGMSLRDYFAGQALSGLLANGGMDTSMAVKSAYQFADSMLKERER